MTIWFQTRKFCFRSLTNIDILKFKSLDAREKQKSKKGICQKYQFIIYIEEDIIMLKEETKQIKINVKEMHCITFPDDNALVADPEENANKFNKYPPGIQE